MCLFFETVRVENFDPQNIFYHNLRLNKTIKENFDLDANIDLKDFIKAPSSKTYRCKVTYDKKIKNIEFAKYVPRKFEKFKIVHSDIEYRYKKTDRAEINALFEKKEDYDDIIIVKNKLLCDTSIANIALFINNVWLTPKQPLLKGTMREKLLEEKYIFEEDLRVSDLKKANKFAIMNALIGFITIPIDGLKL